MQVTDPKAKVAHVILSIVEEPGRALTGFFMQAAEGRLRNDAPFMFDLALPEFSPVLACKQYLSGMLRGMPDAANIVWQADGGTSFYQWAKQHPVHAAWLRRAILKHGADTADRFGVYSRPPFVLATLGDPRSPLAYRKKVSDELHTSSECCLRPGVARLAKSDSWDLLGKEAETFFFSWSLATTMSLSDTERLHATNKRCLAHSYVIPS